MKLIRVSGFALVVLLSLAIRSEAGWHGGGGGYYGGGGGYHGGGGGYWHGGGWGWGGPGVVYVGPGCYYPPYPYYGDPYYYGGYPVRPVYPAAGADPTSVAVPVQEELTRMGYYHGPIDGIVGSGTRSAISAYQRNHNMEITGAIDEPLLRALRL